MILTIFCLLMLAAFFACLIATKSAYVLFGAVLLIFLLTGILRRPVSYAKNRWIFVFYRLTLRVVPATETITGNPNEIVFYRLDRSGKHSLVAVNAGEEQVVSGMTLYSYRGRPLFVLFPVPRLLHAVWQANLFFAFLTAAALTALAAVGFFPYLRLRHTSELLSHTAQISVGHSDSADVIDDPVSDNVLLLCRDPENGIDMMELFCFRHSSSEVTPLYLNPGLYAETSPGCYETISSYAKKHTPEELTAMIESQYYLRISDVISLEYSGLCAAAEAAGGIPLVMQPEMLQKTALKAETEQTDALPEPDAAGAVLCNWQQVRAYLQCDAGQDVPDVTAQAQREAAVTDALLKLFAEINAGDMQFPDAAAAQTSFTAERLYKLSEMLRSDRTHYAAAYAACTEPEQIGTYCLPRAGHFRAMQDGSFYTAPGVLRQYVIRLMYY